MSQGMTAAATGVCTNCGYDLSGLPESASACPECGVSRILAGDCARADQRLRYAVLLLCWGLPLGLAAWFLPTTIRLTAESGQTFPIRHAWPLLLVGCSLSGAGLISLARSPLVVMSPGRRRWIGWLVGAIIACVVIRLSIYSERSDGALLFQPHFFKWDVSSFLSLSRAAPYPLTLAVFVLSAPAFVALSVRAGGASRTWWVLRSPLVPAVALAAMWVLLHSTVFWERPLLWRSAPTPGLNVSRTAATVAAAGRQGFPEWYMGLNTAARVGFTTLNTGLCVAVWMWLLSWRVAVADGPNNRR
ncbi:MAG: hypothetical protein IT438_02485 [Phycisphaerales bacterium]|nr:hypothetical protein [Phycisphaerales bacterium]